MGELFLWMKEQIWDPSNEIPLATGSRIATSRVNARPTWLEAGNWGSRMLTSACIDYFHSYGIKVSCRLWSHYGPDNATHNMPFISLDTILHSMDPNNGISGSVDYQLSIGPNIDQFTIDETSQGSSAATKDYYNQIAQYVRSKGKIIGMNVGGDVNTSNYPYDTITLADVISFEFNWYNPVDISQALAHPEKKFMATGNDWGYANINLSGCVTPQTADPNDLADPADPTSGRPAFTAPMSTARAVWETRYAWNHGIYYYYAQTDDVQFPSATWWNDYLNQLSGTAPPPPGGTVNFMFTKPYTGGTASLTLT